MERPKQMPQFLRFAVILLVLLSRSNCCSARIWTRPGSQILGASLTSMKVVTCGGDQRETRRTITTRCRVPITKNAMAGSIDNPQAHAPPRLHPHNSRCVDGRPWLDRAGSEPTAASIQSSEFEDRAEIKQPQHQTQGAQQQASRMTAAAGYIAILLSTLGFGSNYVPVKRYDSMPSSVGPLA